jgi:hypothetical protein
VAARTFNRTLCLILALALVLAGSAVAAAAKYKGKTEQNRPVTFKKGGGKVKGFEAGINVYCVQSGTYFDAVIPPKAMKIGKDGRFHYKGRDKADGSNIEIDGKIKGKKASGKVNLSSPKYNSSSGTFDSCIGQAKWTAKKQ